MHLAQRIIVAVVLVWAVCIAPPAARGCSCTNNLTLQEEFDFATGVFSGQVLSVIPSYLPDMNWVVLQPITRWKGGLSDPIGILTPASDAICGYPFVAGQEYLVFYGIRYFGITYTPTPYTQLCSRTSLLAGNVYVSLLPPPVLPVPVRRHSWGGLKLIYR